LQILLHTWRDRLNGLASIQVGLAGFTINRSLNKSDLSKKFKSSAAFKALDKSLKDAKGDRLRFPAKEISSSKSVAIFRWTSYDLESVKDASRRAAAMHFALQESQENFILARTLLLSNAAVAELRTSFEAIASNFLDRDTPFVFPWWDAIKHDGGHSSALDTQRSVDALAHEIALNAQYEQEVQALKDLRKKIESCPLLSINPTEPLTKRILSETTSKSITRLLVVSIFILPPNPDVIFLSLSPSRTPRICLICVAKFTFVGT
jgi:hypothetical protein